MGGRPIKPKIGKRRKEIEKTNNKGRKSGNVQRQG